MKNTVQRAIIDNEFIKRVIGPELQEFDERLNEEMEHEFPMEGEHGSE